MLNDDEIDEFVHTNFKAFQCFLRGFSVGLAQGADSQRLTQSQAMDEIVRRTEATRLNNDLISTSLKTTMSWPQVEAARAASKAERPNDYTGGPVQWDPGTAQEGRQAA